MQRRIVAEERKRGRDDNRRGRPRLDRGSGRRVHSGGRAPLCEPARPEPISVVGGRPRVRGGFVAAESVPFPFPPPSASPSAPPLRVQGGTRWLTNAVACKRLLVPPCALHTRVRRRPAGASAPGAAGASERSASTGGRAGRARRGGSRARSALAGWVILVCEVGR